MKLIKLELHNIGPYSNQTINLKTNSLKNIVLICGENGAGKTTLLRSIKVGLFGNFLYGYKQMNASNLYIDEVKSLITNGNSNARISITFSIVEDYVETIYELSREWNIDPKFKENVELYVNSVLVSKEELLDKIEYINHYFSPRLIESMMFDGEKIINYIDDDLLEDYIKEIIIYSFNLNYYLDLKDDLQKYLEKDLKQKNLTVEQIQLSELEKKIKNDKSSYNNLNDKIKKLELLKEKNDFSIDEKINEFSNLGGLTPKELKNITESLKSLEDTKNTKDTQIKEYFENEFILSLNNKMIKKTHEQIELEQPLRYSEYLEEMNNSNILSDEDKKIVAKLKEKIIHKPDNKRIIGLSKTEEIKFDEYYHNLNEVLEKHKFVIQLKEKHDETISILKKKSQKSKNAVLDNLYQEINELISENNKLRSEIENDKEKTLDIKDILDNEELQLPELKNVVYEQAKNNDSFVLANKYIDVCKEYIASETKQITSNVSKITTELLNKTYRKDNYITKVIVDENFSIYALSGKNRKIIKQLSAGEKQIFVAALIVSIVKLSKRNLPLVFDTPAGRLDNEHMSKFYEQIMARAGNQIIILPTSKEINDKVINGIKDRLTNCYTLEYQDDGHTDVLSNKIFERGVEL